MELVKGGGGQAADDQDRRNMRGKSNANINKRSSGPLSFLYYMRVLSLQGQLVLPPRGGVLAAVCCAVRGAPTSRSLKWASYSQTCLVRPCF